MTSHSTNPSCPQRRHEPSQTRTDDSNSAIECTFLRDTTTADSSNLHGDECNAEVPVLQYLVQMVNDVYDIAEQGMWKVKGFRTNLTEMQQFVATGELMVAKLRVMPTGATSIVGCVRVRKLTSSTHDDDACGSLGMLVVDPAHRGQGIGRRLVQAAEAWAVHQGLRCMQLELLKPRTWKHPTKEFNQAWYTRLGYVHQGTDSFAQEFPQIANLLATECDYTIWKKTL